MKVHAKAINKIMERVRAVMQDGEVYSYEAVIEIINQLTNMDKETCKELFMICQVMGAISESQGGWRVRTKQELN